MVNIISKLEQRNKNLLEENENLKQQLIELANKEQDLNLRIYNTVENVKENESPEIAGTLMTLEQHFLPKDINELTLEEFVKGCTEWTLLSCNSLSYVSEQNKKLEEKNAELEKKVVELEKENTELEKTNQELEEALEIEEETSECHLDALEVAKQWRIRQSKEKDDKIEMLGNAVIWQSYLRGKELKELPSLPKKEKRFKLLSNKVKNKVSQTKEIVREKFNAYILQKSK